ncbi:hypothetical protein F4776DRAFT_612327 [Hypoxylon sp. NC0597]|nr:hypothetical protein F4776DRAFT_612327 [Hypoxylon sp. NC0597]
MKDIHDMECLLVGKRGAATGVTWGRGNPAPSIIRRDGLVTKGWGILCLFRKHFVSISARGDLGSAAFDVGGRVAGIVTGGEGMTDTLDITYVTPMEWLMKDMKNNGNGIFIP